MCNLINRKNYFFKLIYREDKKFYNYMEVDT
jgi:hypothetical protein